MGNQSHSQLEETDLKEETTNVYTFGMFMREEAAKKKKKNAPLLMQRSIPNEVKLYLNQLSLTRKYDPLIKVLSQ